MFYHVKKLVVEKIDIFVYVHDKLGKCNGMEL